MDESPSGTGVVPMDILLSQDGLSFLQGMIAGKYPPPPITETLGFTLVEVEHGRAKFAGMPSFKFYNPINVVHGGWAATLLDSALGCAVHSTCAKGEAYTTLEVKVNMVRGITKDTGEVFSEARILHRGRTMGTAEA